MSVFSKLYPWQLLTRLTRTQLGCQLPLTLDPTLLKEDLAGVLENFVSKPQRGQYHDGKWKAISLIGKDGNPADDSLVFHDPVEKTSALKYAPYIESFLESLESRVIAARILILAPSSRIYWHYDGLGIDTDFIRLHIPIVTSKDVHFQISHQAFLWQPGEVWVGDFTFPHRVWNSGVFYRVHLVVDLEKGIFLNELLASEKSKKAITATMVRSMAQKSFEIYDSWFGRVKMSRRFNERHFRKLKECENNLKEIIEIQPDNVDALKLMEKVLLDQGLKNDAIKFKSRIESLSPEDVHADIRWREDQDIRNQLKKAN